METEPISDSSGIKIFPRNVYGLRTDIIGNIHINLNQEVIYPVEGVLAFHDFNNNRQRFLRFEDNISMLALAMSPSKKLLAILESDGKGTQISIYDLVTLAKRRCIPVPQHEKQGPGHKLMFTTDSRGVILLTKYPDEWLFLFMLDSSSNIYEGQPKQPHNRGTIECLACHPADNTIVVVGGDSNLYFMAKSEDKGFTVAQNFKINFHVTSMTYCTTDWLWLGTADNELILVEGNDVKLRQRASTADLIDTLWDQDALDIINENKFYVPEVLNDNRVLGLHAYPRGFFFNIFNRIYVYERSGKFKFERKSIITIPVLYYAEKLYQICNTAVDSKQETIIATTRHAQIYKGSLKIPESTRNKNTFFEPLGLLLHIDNIVHVSVCAWKPIIMTASRDRTIRVWNYEAETIELVKKFQVDVNIAELNVTGLFVAIGFTDQIRIAEIFMDDLNIVKTYNFPRCKVIKYSDLGHYMAVAYDNIIVIISVYNLEVIYYLRGHNGIVLSIYWSKNDRYLLSGGAEGAIYQWDMETGQRVHEIVQKGTEYRALCCPCIGPLVIYASTNHGILREFQKSELVREIVIPSRSKCGLIDMCLARSDLIMFITNELGELFNIKLPFMDAGGGTVTSNRFFIKQVNKVVFSYDGTLLITVSAVGTLAIWNLHNIEGKVAPLDPDLLRSQEILIPRTLLKEKNDQIYSLELRLKQQVEEFQYQLSQNEMFDVQQMAEVHQRYCAVLEGLKNINADLTESHSEQMNLIMFKISDLKKNNRKEIQTMSNDFSERLLVEYQKSSNLRDTILKLQENYEGKLKKSAGTLQSTMESLESSYKKQLDERKDLIRELLDEMGDKKVEFIEFCRLVEVENSRNIIELQSKYENKLNIERKLTRMWRGRGGVLQKKFETLNLKIEELVEEIETLRDEHLNSQRNIFALRSHIDDLQKDVFDRDFIINSKENSIQELQRKNMELDKYKQVLAHRIADLKGQIEPCEFQINDKRKQILQLEDELADLNQNNVLMETKLKELRGRYIANVGDLRLERYRSKTTREYIHTLCSDIYKAAGMLHKPKKMQIAIREMFLRHANDNELKRYVFIDAQVREEFERQRAYIESVLKAYKNKTDNPAFKKLDSELLERNINLLKEIELQRDENKKLMSEFNKFVRENVRFSNVSRISRK